METAESAEELEEIKEAHDAVDSDNVESRTLLEKLIDTDDQAVYEVPTSTDGTPPMSTRWCCTSTYYWYLYSTTLLL
ncbi:hypothetical protein PF005_g21545 [Phytophthora fragariae]|uniref:Uncharacterized protein n=1 Tax=Phytophthora fragariae TaxID=53985 RepID=A0A6A3QWD5_9STRA|nr:hypothetical protein PF003_g33948 [Phytophthora fragariae]KAE8927551.1 hypothetical protein PF009_g22289 [Phytophthora fragariae]KAE9084693.1 hypothetical protein PF007_g21423 [Phytophthora fragariae]KAE9096266.1 hypothetical protein PF006_g23824 [Phytophthora fragariae]KAE9184780.1 hypothetical protein PF005_g21545 [Phytophthora fragariae]